MIALVVFACFISVPGTCRAFQIPMPDQADTFACLMSAPPMLPQWSADHPGWTVTKWSCSSSQYSDL